jgi:arylsulfatase A-like enzyme
MRQKLATLVLYAGIALFLWAVASNAFGLDDAPGFVRRQIRLATLGAALAVLGLLASDPLRQRLLRFLRGAPAVGAVECIGQAAWFGLLTGIAEAVHQGARKLATGVIVQKPPEIVWMAPLSYALLGAAAGAVLAGIARLWPKLVTLPVVVFAGTLGAAFSQCLFYPWHRLSMLVLALGIAAQAARSSAARPALWRRLPRATAPWLVTLVVLAGFVVGVGRAAEERAARPRVPAPDGAPNVLLVVLDTVRADHTQPHGYARATTPRLLDLARAGVVFETAVATAPWTLPSHASMFTGRYPHELTADWLTPLDAAHPTLAEVLTRHGYATGGFVGNLAYCLREQGIARGFQRYEDFGVTPTIAGFSTMVGERLLTRASSYPFNELLRHDAATVAERFLRWRAEIGARPFFAFLNFYDAHLYYLAPPPYDTLFGPKSPHLRKWYSRRDWNAEERQGFVDAYDGCIAYMDEQLGRLLDTLREEGVLANTVVVVTSDHGELFWEHGLTEHGNCLYRPLLHVPLVIWDGRAPRAQRIAETVTLRDLAATLLDLAGVAPELPGTSLARFWKGGAPPAEPSPILSLVSKGIGTAPWAPHSKGDMQSLIALGCHYIRNGDGSEEVYEWPGDSREERALEASPGVLAWLRGEVERLLAR